VDEFAISGFRRHYDSVYRFVRRRAASSAEAEDLTQEVFEAALVAFADRRLVGELSLPWLYTVAERRLIGAWRRSQPTVLLESENVAALPSAESYGNRVSESLLSGLRDLPEGQRAVVVLKLFRGLPFAEIASRLGISEEACRMRLSRGLATLRDHLEAEGVEP
jgi:RNA polymerase sigma-70 factor (ECF subfamily)